MTAYQGERAGHIESAKNPHVKRVAALTRDAGTRRGEGMYVCEGRRLFDDALRAGAEISAAYMLPEICEEYAGRLNGLTVYTLSRPALDAMSEVKAPQGLVFLVRVKAPDCPGLLLPGGRWVILDRVSDPGNVGAILRSADAFGIDGVALSPFCADLYSPKVVRAGMGAHFRVTAAIMDPSEAMRQLRLQGASVFAACVGGDTVLGKDPLPGVFSVIIGSEAEGVSEDLIQAADATVSIPMAGGAESLNAAAAAAIFMWEMAKCTMKG